MFHNAQECPQGVTIEADICIIGAGLAALAMAREFLGRAERVVILEGGDTDYSRWSQALYRATNAGAPNHASTFSRFRLYGGTGTRWSGQCVPLESIDFEQREAMAHSGWPFDLDHLTPYYQRAGEIFEFGPPGFDLTAWQEYSGKIDPIVGEQLTASIIRFAQSRDLGARLQPDLEASGNVHVWLNANVVGFDTNEETTQVSAVHIKTRSGHALTCQAGKVVLACGGIENARLLLASQEDRRYGLGNEYDLVGRYFMDHPYLTTGEWRPSNKAKATGLHLIDNSTGLARKRGAHAVFTLSESLRRQEQLNGCVGYFMHQKSWQMNPAYYAKGGRALMRTMEYARGRPPDSQLLGSILEMLSEPRQTLSTLSGRLSANPDDEPRLALRMAVEATPNPQSRITLSRKRDALGLPRAHIDWRVNEDDWRGVSRFRQLLAKRIRRCELGELHDDKRLTEEGWPRSMGGGKHHMGTTRMHIDPKQGVVDASSRIHSVNNMYVAGSSVFPTGGWANPTYTIIALAIRLADHLKTSS